MSSQLQGISARLVADAARVRAVLAPDHPVCAAMDAFGVGVPLVARDGFDAALVAVWAPVADALGALADAVERDPSAADGAVGDRFVESLGADRHP